MSLEMLSFIKIDNVNILIKFRKAYWKTLYAINIKKTKIPQINLFVHSITILLYLISIIT